MKILVVGAHPDDIEFGVGGLIIKEVKKGTKIKYLVCSLGEAGTSGTPEERKKEATTAAEFVGAEIEFLDFGGDCHMEAIPNHALKIAKVIREFKPNIILAPSKTQNQHPDHIVVSKLARDASRLARYGGLGEIKNLAVHKIDGLYYYPSSAELDEQPDILVDVSENYESWVKAMELHASQMKTKGYVNLVSTKAVAWGASIGVKYAVGLWVNDPIRLDYLSDLSLSSRNY